MTILPHTGNHIPVKRKIQMRARQGAENKGAERSPVSGISVT